MHGQRDAKAPEGETEERKQRVGCSSKTKGEEERDYRQAGSSLLSQTPHTGL